MFPELLDPEVLVALPAVPPLPPTFIELLAQAEEPRASKPVVATATTAVFIRVVRILVLSLSLLLAAPRRTVLAGTEPEVPP